MKLSDAAVLGAATWKRVCYPVDDASDGEKQGCFLQLALRAVGFSSQEVTCGIHWADLTAKTWPWTNAAPAPEYVSYATRIWYMNDLDRPFEEILAFVRSVEPAEPQTEPAAEENFARNEQMRIAHFELSTGERE